MSTGDPVPLSLLALDLPTLDRRGLAIVIDDLGRECVDRATARALFAEHREQQEAAARKRAQIEERVIEADRRFRASLPVGVPAGAVPTGMSAAELMMASDPFPAKRRQSVLEHSLENPAGSIIYTPIGEDAP